MKRNFVICMTFLLVFLCMFTLQVHAEKLDNINVTTSKEKVNPDEEITLNIEFGANLGAYTFNIKYDKALLEYKSVEGGAANNLEDRIKVVYPSELVSSGERGNMRVTFKAKSDITTSNPTNFEITAEGLSSSDTRVTYDNITDPIIKEIVVEPKYENYQMHLDYAEDVFINEEKAMNFVMTSSMGRPYEHARIQVKATTPDGGNVQLVGSDENGTTYNLIQSGWGNPSGYQIGGRNMRKVLELKGTFNKVGTYGLTFQLIDRDSADEVVAEQTFHIEVKDPATMLLAQTATENNTVGTIQANQTTEQLPATLPKTGNNMYVGIAILVVLAIVGYAYFKSLNNNQF